METRRVTNITDGITAGSESELNTRDNADLSPQDTENRDSPSDLVSCDAELDGHFHRLIDDSGRRLDQRHEEEREPDDANESKDDESSHPIFDHLLLPLPRRVWIFLDRNITGDQGRDLNFWYCFTVSITFSDSLQHLRMKMLA